MMLQIMKSLFMSHHAGGIMSFPSMSLRNRMTKSKRIINIIYDVSSFLKRYHTLNNDPTEDK